MTMRSSSRHLSPSRVLASILILCCGGLQAKAQGTCPFLPSESVPDTLNFRQYYPLDVGNVWEYVVEGAFIENLFRRSVVGDTLIEGKLFHKVEAIGYPFGSPIVTADTSVYFEAITDSNIVRNSSGSELEIAISLGSDFNSCYTDHFGELWEVPGGYEKAFTVPEDGIERTYAVPAIKTFSSWSIGSALSFAYGIGRIRTEGDPFLVERLVYARIDGKEMGTPLDSLYDIRVGVANQPLPNSSALSVYPNPTNSRAHVELDLDRSDEVSLRLYDVLGREVSEILGQHQWTKSTRVPVVLDGLPNGVYFVVVRTSRGTLLQKPVVYLR